MTTKITPDLVKKLRQRSGSGILDCKKALEASGGDIEQAFEALRKSGQAKAAKKAANAVGEGVVAIKTTPDRKLGAMVEINCQTDFVARNTAFSEFAEQLLDIVLTLSPDKATLEALMEQPFDEKNTVASAREALVTRTGENVQISRINQVQAKGELFSYVHDKRIAVLVDLKGGNEALGKDIAMHIAASRPLVVSPDDIPQALIEKEKEIYKAQAANLNKPEPVLEKIIQGKLDKFANESSLVGQPFVKEPSKTVGALLKAAQAEACQFARYEKGEKSLEKA